MQSDLAEAVLSMANPFVEDCNCHLHEVGPRCAQILNTLNSRHRALKQKLHHIDAEAAPTPRSRASSLLIRLDPDASPAALPSVSAAGPAAEAIEVAVTANSAAWKAGADVADFVSNLRALLGGSALLAEPSAVETEQPVAGDAGVEAATEDVDCGICYADCSADGPDCVTCERCRRRYHRSCAVEWLRGLPDTRQGFNRLHGCCPYCRARLCVLQDCQD
ncbi:hypothetical protein BOX15_Mlig027751g1 [Macrostomum lignano]|uniref:RING-type domain-containing protein n=1 Tax=Macrostomum lignano TaxID=282301 RepID=A0A267DW29_9PLAT|nr:hypothetical protein BOX15_Mlig027751g1 [Macrostomum lignano]